MQRDGPAISRSGIRSCGYEEPAMPDPAPRPTIPVPLTSERFQADPELVAVATGEKLLAEGARGDAVRRVQLALLTLGEGLSPGVADGDFGPATRDAVDSFQRVEGLGASGAVDAATLARLDARVRI